MIILFAVDTAENVVDASYAGGFDSLSEIYKRRRADRRRGQEFASAKKILDVWILSDRFCSLPVAQIKHGLNEQGAKRQSCRFGNITFKAGEFARILDFYLIPRDDFGQFNPAIISIKLSIPWRGEIINTDLFFLFKIHSILLRSPEILDKYAVFRTIYYTINSRKRPVFSLLRFVEQA
jgi:hypothetical protein